MKKYFKLFTALLTFSLLALSCAPAPKLAPASAYDRVLESKVKPQQAAAPAILKDSVAKNDYIFSRSYIDSLYPSADSLKLPPSDSALEKSLGLENSDAIRDSMTSFKN
jgi:hypothetical protein